LFSSRTPDRFFRAGSTCLFLLGLWAAAPAQFSARAQAPQAPDDKLTRARRVMVERDLGGRGIKDPKVLDAMRLVPRHLFVPAAQVGAAYEDRPLPIGAGQTISQPYIVALMSELLELKESEKLLEIGTGSGYQAAVLSRLAREIYTIEIVPGLAERAKETLARLGYHNVQIKTGDGFYGWEEKSPFDAVLLTAAAERIPEPLWRQLREEGRLVMPMGKEGQTQKLVRVKKIAGQRRVERIMEVIFVPMTGEVRKEAR
jgi:protein-L-isoaspartate(D-aspartate) O-methyltransferase